MLLEHNIETYKQLCDTMDNYGHAIIIQTTGSGKSYIALEYIESNKLNTLIVVPTHVIGKQWCKKSELISYVCYNTFVKMVDFSKYDLVIFDEAHHLGAKTYEVAFKKFIGLSIPYIGLTADSRRWSDSARDIADEYFSSSTINGLSLDSGIKDGILPSIEYTVALYSPSELISRLVKDKKISESLVAKLKYTIDNVESITDIINRKICKSNIKGVLFVDAIDSIPAAHDLLINTFGNKITILDIHSKHSRKFNMNQVDTFESLNNAFIISVNMLNEGLHVNGVNTIIMLRRTQSPNVYFQQLGRGISINTDDSNNKLQVFDLVGNKNLLKVVDSKGSNKILIHSPIEKTESDQFIIDDRTIDILDVLCDIRNDLSNHWEQWEEEKIRSDYPEKGSNIPELIANGRTKLAIRRRAGILGVRCYNETKVWESWEDEKIKSDYPKNGTNIPELIANGRTRGAIRSRAKYLHVYNKNHVYSWEPWEDEKVKSDYPKKGSNIPELIANGKAKWAITKRAKYLNVSKRNSTSQWEPWEDEKLKSDYLEKGTNIPELIANGRTREAIASRACIFGIQCRPEYKKWSDQAVEKLKSDYPKKGSNIPELIEMGYNKESIVTKANRMGLTRRTSWSECEINKLKSDYPTKGCDIPELLNNGKSKRAIYKMAYNLGIKRILT